MEDFRLLCKLGAGTFSEVLKVKHRKTSKVYAMKRFRKHFNSFEEVEGLREIQALRRLNPHQNIVDLVDVIFDPKHGVLALNFELMECNLYELISRKGSTISEQRAKGIIYQLLKALEYMHSKGIFHRDIKPENILVRDNLVKLADFGSCRGVHSKPPYTEYIATRWYRSPECLMCEGMYTYKMDIWGVGCVLFETLSKNPLFPGANQVDQLHRINSTLGTPSTKLMKHMLGAKASQPQYQFPPKEGTGIRPLIPHVSHDCFDLIMQLLLYDPNDRLTAKEALRHQFLRDVPADIGLVPSSSAAAGSRRDLRAADGSPAQSFAKHASHVALQPQHGDQAAAAPADDGSRMPAVAPPPGIRANQEDASGNQHAAGPHQAKPPQQHRQKVDLVRQAGGAAAAAGGGEAGQGAPPAAAKAADADRQQQKPLARPPPAQIPPRRAEKEQAAEGPEAEHLAQGKAAKRKKPERKPAVVKRAAPQLSQHGADHAPQAQQAKGTVGQLRGDGMGVVGRSNPAAAASKDPRKLPSLQASQHNYVASHQPEHNFSTRGQNFPALANAQQQQQAAAAMMLMMQSNAVMFGRTSYNSAAAKDQPVTLPSLMDRRHGGLPASAFASASGVSANKHATSQR